MKYKVVTEKRNILEYAVRNVEEEVIKLSKEGWKLQGGISIAVEPFSDYHMETTYYAAQAMVKED